MSSEPLFPPPAPLSELTKTFGVLLIGFIFAVTLYGLTFFQTYIYFTRFPSDHTGSKYAVGLLWAVDTATTTLLSHTLYYYLITSFMASFDILDITKTFVAEVALAAFAVLLVQLFYASRIWTVNSKNPAIPGLIALIALGSFALGVAGAAMISQQSFFYNMITDTLKVIMGVGSGTAVLCNLIIMSGLFYYMQPERNPGMLQPKGLYDRMVINFFNRGTCFTVMQLVTLITFVTMPSQQVWVLFHFINSKVYVNSLLATLNFRHTHHGRGINEEESLNQNASKSGGSTSASGQTGRDTSRSVQFNVHTDTKTGNAMTIELDTVASRGDVGYDDESGKAAPGVLEIGGKGGSGYSRA